MGVSVARGGASLKGNLIEPLRAETLLALTYNANDGCTSVASCALAARWPALTPFAAVDMQPMLSLEVLTRTLEGLPHWPSIYLGNTIFAPVLGSPKLHVLRQLHDIHRCLNVAAARERSVGRMYDRIVHTRPTWTRLHANCL